MPAREDIEQRFARNIERVRNLVETYEGLTGSAQGRRPVHRADILRAATVFLHAALEDLLRNVEGWKLPLGDEGALAGVSLVGTEGRAEKFVLGKLVAHRGKSVDALIEESVTEHLDRKSYNDTEMICGVLQRIGVDTAPLTPLLPGLSDLIQRRHNIVHRADRDDTPGSGHHGAKAISKGSVRWWTDNVERFATAVFTQI